MGMAELINKWEVVNKLITLQNNYNFFKNEWDAERLYREIAKLEIEVGKAQGLEVVRCKDCDFTCEGSYGLVCTAWGAGTDPDMFCSKGERRNDV